RAAPVITTTLSRTVNSVVVSTITSFSRKGLGALSPDRRNQCVENVWPEFKARAAACQFEQRRLKAIRNESRLLRRVCDIIPARTIDQYLVHYGRKGMTMNRRRQIQLSPDEQAAFLREHRKAALATIGKDGFPHVVAMNFLAKDGAFY